MALLAPAFERRANVSESINLSAGGDAALSSLFGGMNNTKSGQVVNADTALAISTVFACVNRKAKTLAMLPLEVRKRLPNRGHEVAHTHRLFKQLNSKPNAWQTSFDWRLMGQGHIMLRGNFYNYIQPTPGRALNQLVPMHPDRVWPFVKTPNGSSYYINDTTPTPPVGSVLYYQYFPVNGETLVLTADQVLHIKGYSINGIVGMSVIKKLMNETVGLAMAMEEQGARLFTNGAQIGKVFKHPTKLDDVAFERLSQQLAKYSGSGNAHKTIILENGMDIEKISMTMEEAQFLDSRKFQVEDICSFLDVPMMLIHRSGDKNQTFASAEVINQMFITYNMQPEFRNWEERLECDLLFPSESQYFFKFDFDEMLRGDAGARATYYKARFDTASLTPNDIKRKEGESPYTNKPECDTVYVTPGVTTAVMAGKEKVITPVSPKQPEEPPEKDNDES